MKLTRVSQSYVARLIRKQILITIRKGAREKKGAKGIMSHDNTEKVRDQKEGLNRNAHGSSHHVPRTMKVGSHTALRYYRFDGMQQAVIVVVVVRGFSY